MWHDKLTRARNNKKDEFYTKYSMVADEMKYCSTAFKNQVVYCPCDDPINSEIVYYFIDNFTQLGLKELISTCISYSEEEKGKYFVMNRDKVYWGHLDGDGDFRSEETTKIRDRSDIIITNPPFSLFRDIFKWVMDGGKKFSLVGNVNAVKYKTIFPYIIKQEVWMGKSIRMGGRYFKIPSYYEVGEQTRLDEDGELTVRVGGIRWFTNLYSGDADTLTLEQKYDEEKYPKYDNYDAINVNKTLEIPYDYEGIMGVPITFLDKYCSTQFEVLGKSSSLKLNGKALFERIFIRKHI